MMPGRKAPKAKTRKATGTGRDSRGLDRDRTLAAVVGPQTYSVWVDMLRTLVPYGRTPRLSVVIAGMLQYAADVGYRSTHGKAPQGSVAASLLTTSEGVDAEEIGRELGDVLRRLLRDAKVSATRVSARGDRYSILDDAIHEYLYWESMPWEST